MSLSGILRSRIFQGLLDTATREVKRFREVGTYSRVLPGAVTAGFTADRTVREHRQIVLVTQLWREHLPCAPPLHSLHYPVVP
jgi:hypothetical protein